MSTPQAALFTLGSSHYHFLELNCREGVTREGVAAALRALAVPPPPPPEISSAAINALIALGPSLWRHLAAEVPPSLGPFPEQRGPKGLTAPSTQRDILLWFHGQSESALFDRARWALEVLHDVAQVELDQACFTYHDARDLTGFVDGSANPEGEDLLRAALIADGSCAGGSLVMTQKWLHKLRKFGALQVAEQERIIGRTKPDSVELEGDALPPDSHVGRTDFVKAGVPMKIYRRSAPFGTPTEGGLMFLAFACDADRFTTLLERMYDPVEPDRLLDFTTPMSGSYWYAPSVEQLGRL